MALTILVTTFISASTWAQTLPGSHPDSSGEATAPATNTTDGCVLVESHPACPQWQESVVSLPVIATALGKPIPDIQTFIEEFDSRLTEIEERLRDQADCPPEPLGLRYMRSYYCGLFYHPGSEACADRSEGGNGDSGNVQPRQMCKSTCDKYHQSVRDALGKCPNQSKAQLYLADVDNGGSEELPFSCESLPTSDCVEPLSNEPETCGYSLKHDICAFCISAPEQLCTSNTPDVPGSEEPGGRVDDAATLDQDAQIEFHDTTILYVLAACAATAVLLVFASCGCIYCRLRRTKLENPRIRKQSEQPSMLSFTEPFGIFKTRHSSMRAVMPSGKFGRQLKAASKPSMVVPPSRPPRFKEIVSVGEELGDDMLGFVGRVPPRSSVGDSSAICPPSSAALVDDSRLSGYPADTRLGRSLTCLHSSGQEKRSPAFRGHPGSPITKQTLASVGSPATLMHLRLPPHTSRAGAFNGQVDSMTRGTSESDLTLSAENMEEGASSGLGSHLRASASALDWTPTTTDDWAASLMRIRDRELEDPGGSQAR